MPDRADISWVPEARTSNLETAAMETDDFEESDETGRHDGRILEVYHTVDTPNNTQRNTPTALSAQKVDDPDESDYFNFDGLSASSEYGLSRSPLSGPRRYQQPLPPPSQNSASSLTRLSDSQTNPSARLVSPAAHSRGLSSRTSQNQLRGRRTSHAKSFSSSFAASNRSTTNGHPSFPEQSLKSLQDQLHAPRPTRPLRTKSSLPAQNLLYSEMSLWSHETRDRQSGNSHGARTTDNTPMSSPALQPDDRIPSMSSLSDAGRQQYHLSLPRETDQAVIDHDTFSGNKMINDYEVIEEIGRGEHGKVKRGRNILNETVVAIKIVPRFSGKRRLGRLGTPEDRTKREVAILKKARHPNIVSLLEVIDDPNKKKVYLILEYVEKGEIKWRKPGVREVLAVNNSRFELERDGVTLSLEATEKDIYNVTQAKRRHELQDRTRASNSHRTPNVEHYGGDRFVEDEEHLGISRSTSRGFNESSNTSRTNSHDNYTEGSLAGSMYGPYEDSYRPRKYSIAPSLSAVSHMSSEWNFDEIDDEHAYVPALTLEEARRAFRDTLTGLHFLHFIGIIHRDIKPANLLVTGNGAVKISDFGVSYLGHPLDPEKDPEYDLTEKDVSTLDDEKELARSVGTPAFWAPELCYEDPSMFEEKEGPRITGAIDLWALGITLYCMVYARLPFYASDSMGLHEAVCKTEVFLPKTRLVPVDTTQDKPSAQTPSSINSNKRLDYELKFEIVPDAVRDLIRKLLVKDPSKRMTVDQAKKQEWVMENMQDPAQWIKGPDLEKEGKKKILDPTNEEMSKAFTKMSIIERAINTVKGVAGNFLGRTGSRRRGNSTATSPSPSIESVASTSPSSAGTVGKSERDRTRDARRTSLRGDEFVTALKTSRENAEHPLAQSQTASPDTSGLDHYFSESYSVGKAATSACTPSTGPGTRPPAPDRATSTMSTADSIRTIRASQMQRLPLALPDAPHDDRHLFIDRGIKARVDGLWEGTTKAFARLGSRDRWPRREDRSPVSSHHSSESDAHGGPSVAVSTASAEGAIEPPEALRNMEIPIDYSTAPPTPHMLTHGDHKFSFQAPESTPEAFEQAQEVNQRRLIQEAHLEAAVKANAASRPQTQSTESCPPSPDDLAFLERQHTRVSSEPPTLSLGSNAMHAEPSTSTIASSLDNYETSSISHSMSNPSIGAISNASSPPGEGFFHPVLPEGTMKVSALPRDPEPEFMRTADTVTKHGRPAQVATAPALEDWGQETDELRDDESDDGMMMPMPASRKRKL